MVKNKHHHRLEPDLKSIGIRYAGLYLLNKFFIKIYTGKNRSQIPSYDYQHFNFSDQDQRKLQIENYPTLYHEYIHYVHEVSTMAGIAQFHYNILKRSIFSHFVEEKHPSKSHPITGPMKAKLDKLENTLSMVTGGFTYDMEDKTDIEIDRVEFMLCPAYEIASDSTGNIEIPVIFFNYLDKKTNAIKQECVIFGKYFLYEGLAHNLDQITSAQGGLALTPAAILAPEYKMMAMVAQHYLPNIDLKSTLEMASLSLAYFNCGARFVEILKEAATVTHLPGYIFEIKNQVHEHLTQHRDGIRDTLEEIKGIFVTRSEIHLAASHLCDVMMAGYDQRIKNLVFEIDITLNRQQDQMRNYVDLCQMVYVLADHDDTFMRDFAGSYLPADLSRTLLTFMCHVDYAQTAVRDITGHCCPLYTFCPQQRRKDKPEQCKTNPRLAFDDQPQYGWCEYGLGVAYMTGEDRPQINSNKINP